MGSAGQSPCSVPGRPLPLPRAAHQPAADEAQRSFDDGPARRAVRSGDLCSWATLPWSAAGPGTPAPPQLSEGVPGSVPLVPQSVFNAAVNLYSPWPHVFTSADITAAARLARHVSRALRLVQQLALTSGSSADLSSAQLSRALAGLALRTLVREYGLSEEGALDYLRSVAGGASAGIRRRHGPCPRARIRSGTKRIRSGPERGPSQPLCRGPTRRGHPSRPSTPAQDGVPGLGGRRARAAAKPRSARAAVRRRWRLASRGTSSGRRTFIAPAQAITLRKQGPQTRLRGRRWDEGAVILELRGQWQRNLGPDVSHLQLRGHAPQVFDGADAAAASVADETGRLVVPLLVQVVQRVFQCSGDRVVG